MIILSNSILLSNTWKDKCLSKVAYLWENDNLIIYEKRENQKKIVMNRYSLGNSSNVLRAKFTCLTYHSLEIRSLFLMKWPSEMLQNLPHFIYTKTKNCFFCFSFRATLFLPLWMPWSMLTLTRAFNRGKYKVAWNEKWKK